MRLRGCASAVGLITLPSSCSNSKTIAQSKSLFTTKQLLHNISIHNNLCRPGNYDFTRLLLPTTPSPSKQYQYLTDGLKSSPFSVSICWLVRSWWCLNWKQSWQTTVSSFITVRCTSKAVCLWLLEEYYNNGVRDLSQYMEIHSLINSSLHLYFKLHLIPSD